MRTQKWLGGSLSLQFGRMFVLSPGRSTPHSGSKISKSAERDRKQNFSQWITRGDSEKNYSLSHPLKTWTHESWLWEKLYHIFDANSKDMLISREPCPSPLGYRNLTGAVTVSQKTDPFFYQASYFRTVGNKARQMDSMTTGPLSVTLREVSSLVRSNSVWNNMKIDKTFFKSMDGSVGRSITGRKQKSITRTNIHSSKDKVLSFP